MNKLECFKAYDIRGKVPKELGEELAYKIGLAYSDIINPSTVIVGHDVRLESLSLTRALIKGLTDSGSNVVNIGLCGTEEVYFHSFSNEDIGVGGGIMVTASHNPKGYNGMKMVGRGSRPISLSDELGKIHDYVLKLNHSISNKPIPNPSLSQPDEFQGEIAQRIKIREHKRDQQNSSGSFKMGLGTRGLESIKEDKESYISHIIGYIDVSKLKPLKIVVNPGNGSAGIIIKLLEKFLPFKFVYINEYPDGNFPNGVPNPMIIENRKSTSQAVVDNKADFGIAWDGDFDRCFLFDENGDFIEAYYIVGLLAASFLKKHRNEKIIHDSRLTWNTIDIVRKYGGIPIQSKSGHSFIKEKMRQENAIYGGEMSAHHYFRQFAYCDSGMLPWLLISELLCVSDQSLSSLVSDRIHKFPCSGEINYKIQTPAEIIEKVESHFANQDPIIDRTDGISLEFNDWRLNLRRSNTEPLIRLNLEVKDRKDLLPKRIAEVEAIIFAELHKNK